MKIGKEEEAGGIGGVGGESSSLLGGEKVGESGMVLGLIGMSVGMFSWVVVAGAVASSAVSVVGSVGMSALVRIFARCSGIKRFLSDCSSCE